MSIYKYWSNRPSPHHPHRLPHPALRHGDLVHLSTAVNVGDAALHGTKYAPARNTRQPFVVI